MSNSASIKYKNTELVFNFPATEDLINMCKEYCDQMVNDPIRLDPDRIMIKSVGNGSYTFNVAKLDRFSVTSTIDNFDLMIKLISDKLSV